MKRYKIDASGRPWEMPNGAWVPFDDANALAARLAEAERDAARYRWIRKRLPITAVHCRGTMIQMMPLDMVTDPSGEHYATDVDAAVDSAMRSIAQESGSHG